MTNEYKRVTTVDGLTLPADGFSRAFNYYDMKPGYIGFDLDSDGWFTFRHDDGSTKVLNGERICSIEHASRKGWLR